MNHNNFTISVIIPTYNRARFLKEAIASVLCQTYQNFELIVVDDGSTDNTKKILEPFNDRIIYIYQSNAGCAAARNSGLLNAKGNWVAYLDSDDIWMPDKLQTQVNDLKRFPLAVAHATNVNIYRSHIGKETDIFSYTGFNNTINGLSGEIQSPLLFQLKYGFGWPQSMLTRKDIILKAGGFDTSLKLWQDTDLFYRVATLGTWAYNCNICVKILRREEFTENLSAQSVKDRKKSYREFIYVFGKLLYFIQNNITHTEKQLIISKLQISFESLGMEYAIIGDKKLASKYLWNGMKTNWSFKCVVKFLLLFVPHKIIQKMINNRRREI